MSSSGDVKKATVIGGKLKLKGDSSNSSKKRKIDTVEKSAPSTISSAPKVVDTLTDAQKRHRQKKMEQEALDVKNKGATSFRDRIDTFNAQLSKMTEHNDIPRVSAAGNG